MGRTCVRISQAGRVIRTAVTDGNGNYQIAAVPPGEYAVAFQLAGFNSERHTSVVVRDGMAVDVNSSMRVGAVTETVTVDGLSIRTRSGSGDPALFNAAGALGESETGGTSINVIPRRTVDATPSQSVINLQQRAAGVLPVRIDVPRAGTSLQFVRTLVVDEETMVQLDYRRRWVAGDVGPGWGTRARASGLGVVRGREVSGAGPGSDAESRGWSVRLALAGEGLSRRSLGAGSVPP